MQRKSSFPAVAPRYLEGSSDRPHYIPPADTGKLTDNYTSGDGGPMILLQESVAAQWQGANDWDNSLMNGGTVETDYDVVCTAHQKEQWCIQRFGRAMLVLPNDYCQSHAVTLSSGGIVFFEAEEDQEGIEGTVEEFLRGGIPSLSFPFPIEDTELRLLPSADDGDAQMYGYVKIAVHPGIWTVSFLPREYETITILLPPGTT